MSDQSHTNNPSERRQTTSRPGSPGAGSMGAGTTGTGSTGIGPGSSATSGRPQTYAEKQDDPLHRDPLQRGDYGQHTTYGEQHHEPREAWRTRPGSEHHDVGRERVGRYGYYEGRYEAYMADRRSRSVITTLRELAGDIGLLARQEATLARVEIGEKIDQAKKGLAEAGLGAALAFAGFLFVLAGITFALNLALERLWLSALIVGGLVHLIGLALLASARSSLKSENLKPERTGRSLREDAEMVRNETTRRTHV
jgi:uncharacterized membrane protein YqjE